MKGSLARAAFLLQRKSEGGDPRYACATLRLMVCSVVCSLYKSGRTSRESPPYFLFKVPIYLGYVYMH